jgi:hypothetical protein
MEASYSEVVVTGHAHGAFSYLQGFLEGRGLDPGRIFEAEQEGFACEPLRERIRDLLGPSHATLHLLVPADLIPVVREGIDQGAERGEPIALKDVRPLAGAHFSYTFTAFARPDGERLQALLAPRGEGLTLSPESGVEVTIEPEATGAEAYAPLHEYEACGRGTVSGEVPVVIRFYRRLREEELIRLAALELAPV